jgi:hypothetical protein
MPECFVDVLVIGGGTLAIFVDVERAQLRRGELDGWPFEGDGGLCDIVHLERIKLLANGQSFAVS